MTLRILGAVLLGAVALAGLLAFLAFAVVLISVRDPGERGAAVALMVASLAVLAAAGWGVRRLLRRAPPVPPAEVLADARSRLRAGAPIVLRPRAGRRTAMFLLCATITAGAALALAGAPSAPAAAVAALVGAATLYATLRLVPGRASLGIAPDGLTVRTPLKTTRWSWDAIEHFRAYETYHAYGSIAQVGFDRRDLTPERQGPVRTVLRGMSGVDHTLPDTYGLPHAALAELLQEARERYATDHSTSASELADRALAARAAAIPADRAPAVTAVLAVACVAVFVLATARHGLFPDARELLDAGGTSRDELAAGRWWTLLSANLVHAGPIHLALNLAGLVLLGGLLERELGWPRLAALALVSAVAAMGLAVLVQPGAVVVGLSGVIFAVAGWAVLRDPHRTRALGIVAWSVVPVGVVTTFLVPRVSIGAHLGGLLAGLALGYALERASCRS